MYSKARRRRGDGIIVGMNKKRALNYLIAGVILLVPVFVMAQMPEKLVPCTGEIGDPCNACQLVTLADNILQFLVGLSIFVAIAAFTWAGFLFVTAAGNESQITKAKGTFSAVAIGLIIVLAAWLIIDTLLRITTGDDIDDWVARVCVEAPPDATRPPATNPPDEGDDFEEECKDENLAESYRVPATPRNSGSLNATVDCIMRNSEYVRTHHDPAKLFTFDQDNPKCNFTRGEVLTDCGMTKCSHSTHSCHYGGANHTDGAYAVDFNAIDGDEESLHDAIRKVLTDGQCNFVVLFEGSHTHVSSPDCR